MQCIFCQIINGNIPSKKVFEDDKVLAILDIYPANIGHILLMPKKHYENFTDLEEELVSHIGIISSRLSLVMISNLKSDGVTAILKQSSGSPHCVMHLIPRKNDDKLNMNLQGKSISKEDIENALTEMRKTTEKKEVSREVLDNIGEIL